MSLFFEKLVRGQFFKPAETPQVPSTSAEKKNVVKEQTKSQLWKLEKNVRASVSKSTEAKVYAHNMKYDRVKKVFDDNLKYKRSIDKDFQYTADERKNIEQTLAKAKKNDEVQQKVLKTVMGNESKTLWYQKQYNKIIESKKSDAEKKAEIQKLATSSEQQVKRVENLQQQSRDVRRVDVVKADAMKNINNAKKLESEGRYSTVNLTVDANMKDVNKAEEEYKNKYGTTSTEFDASLEKQKNRAIAEQQFAWTGRETEVNVGSQTYKIDRATGEYKKLDKTNGGYVSVSDQELNNVQDEFKKLEKKREENKQGLYNGFRLALGDASISLEERNKIQELIDKLSNPIINLNERSALIDEYDKVFSRVKELNENPSEIEIPDYSNKHFTFFDEDGNYTESEESKAALQKLGIELKPDGKIVFPSDLIIKYEDQAIDGKVIPHDEKLIFEAGERYVTQFLSPYNRQNINRDHRYELQSFQIQNLNNGESKLIAKYGNGTTRTWSFHKKII